MFDVFKLGFNVFTATKKFKSCSVFHYMHKNCNQQYTLPTKRKANSLFAISESNKTARFILIYHIYLFILAKHKTIHADN